MEQGQPGRMLEESEQRANANAAFGEPRQVGDKTIIPIAQVTWMGGYGFGRGPWWGREREQREAAEPGQPAREAAARAGSGMRVKPIAVLEVSPTETRIRPVVDSTSLVLAGMAMGAWNVFWIAATLRAIFGGWAWRRRQK